MTQDKELPGAHGATQSRIREEDKYRLIVENTPLLVSVATMAADPIITYASPSHETVLGYSPDALVGQSILSIVHPDDVPSITESFNEQLPLILSEEGRRRGKTLNAQAEVRVKDTKGEWRLLDIIGRSLGDELLFASQDITEQREALIQLIDSEQRFRLMFENAPDGYYILDGKGRFMDGNRAAERLVGAPRDEFIGKSFLKAGLLHPKHLPRGAAHLARNLMGRGAGPDEFLLKRRDGKWINIEVTTFPVDHESGKMILGIARDITARKEDMEELEKARQRAEAANKAKSSFLADMSHELRTPLNAIIGFSEVLLDKELSETTELQEEYLKDIRQSGWHLLNLIDEILDLAKVESGRMELRREPVSVKALCDAGLVMVREKARKRGLQLECDADSLPPCLALDERKVKQVIFNMLSNAVKFTPAGGSVCVRASYVDDDTGELGLGEGTADANADRKERPQGVVVVEVEDTGVGIHPDQMESLFETFTQGEHEAQDGSAGTGLGLPLSRRLTELHGGQLTGESDGPEKGARFTAAFPTWELSLDGAE